MRVILTAIKASLALMPLNQIIAARGNPLESNLGAVGITRASDALIPMAAKQIEPLHPVQYEVRVADADVWIQTARQICTAKFTLRASLAERLAKVDFKYSAPLAALTLSLVRRLI